MWGWRYLWRNVKTIFHKLGNENAFINLYFRKGSKKLCTRNVVFKGKVKKSCDVEPPFFPKYFENLPLTTLNTDQSLINVVTTTHFQAFLSKFYLDSLLMVVKSLDVKNISIKFRFSHKNISRKFRFSVTCEQNGCF